MNSIIGYRVVEPRDRPLYPLLILISSSRPVIRQSGSVPCVELPAATGITPTGPHGSDRLPCNDQMLSPPQPEIADVCLIYKGLNHAE
jgi:hypothetical protein